LHHISGYDTTIVLCCNFNRLYFFLTLWFRCFLTFEMATNKGGSSGCGRGMNEGAFIPLGGAAGAIEASYATLLSGRK
jgi:hypothetical protein